MQVRPPAFQVAPSGPLWPPPFWPYAAIWSPKLSIVRPSSAGGRDAPKVLRSTDRSPVARAEPSKPEVSHATLKRSPSVPHGVHAVAQVSPYTHAPVRS